MRTPVQRAAAAAAMLFLVLAGCGQDARDKIEGGAQTRARNTQTEARALFDGLCAVRQFSETECSCMRERMLGEGTQAVAFIGATYGGNLEAAAAAGERMEAAERDEAIQAYFTAELTCAGRVQQDIAADMSPDETAPPPEATLDDVRASCSATMAQVCACRARMLRDGLGDGAYEAAVAINRGDRAMLQSLGAGREAGWADRAADMYARTSAPCIVQAGGR